MSVYTLLDDGQTFFGLSDWKRRLLNRIGHFLAKHPHVHIGEGTIIHPAAKISPRGGEITIGKNCFIGAGTCIQGNITIGDNCSINLNGNIVGYGSLTDKSGEIRIGNYCRIAANVMMIGANHNFDNPDRPIHEQGLCNAPIVLGEDVWLGGYVKITAGCTIGQGSVLGMGSVITKDIAAYSIAVGSPAKVIKSRKPLSSTKVEK